jgi:hypothetical protein
VGFRKIVSCEISLKSKDWVFLQLRAATFRFTCPLTSTQLMDTALITKKD